MYRVWSFVSKIYKATLIMNPNPILKIIPLVFNFRNFYYQDHQIGINFSLYMMTFNSGAFLRGIGSGRPLEISSR